MAVVLVLGAGASAQELDGGTTDAGIVEQSELDNAIDAAAGRGATTAGPQVTTNPLVRAFQSLNPDISVIVDSVAGAAGTTSYSRGGADPDLKGGAIEHPAGVTVQEVEFAFQAIVDPFFRADVFFTVPNLEGVEVEEAFATSTSLPFDLQVRAGIFRSNIGRLNGQHTHVQNFVRRPLLNEAFLGVDGLRSPAVQVSWLAPTPVFLQLSAEAISVGPPGGLEHLSSFGGGERTDLTYTGKLSTFFPLAESVSISAGLNAAFGKTAGVSSETGLVRVGSRTLLQGFDLYVKYKPANDVGSYFSLTWTTEFFFREVLSRNNSEETAIDGAGYTQLVAQIGRNWFVGLRQDLLGLPFSELQTRVSRTAGSLTFIASEFAQLRLEVERETQPSPTQFFLLGRPNWAGYLQLQIAIGAHGAHPF